MLKSSNTELRPDILNRNEHLAKNITKTYSKPPESHAKIHNYISASLQQLVATSPQMTM